MNKGVFRVLASVTVVSLFLSFGLNANARPKFAAWGSYNSLANMKIPIQYAGLDIRQSRQYVADFDNFSSAVSFATSNPGQLYIHGDEPDQLCMSPSVYAQKYHTFVVAIRNVDPTARFSPAGFAQPNEDCCKLNDPSASRDCTWDNHFIAYATNFYNAYVSLYGTTPPVSEWRFHAFSAPDAGAMYNWTHWVEWAADWSRDHGAPMVLGSFGFGATQVDITQQPYMPTMLNQIQNDSDIVGAVWATYDIDWGLMNLVDSNGNFTAAGNLYRSYIPLPSQTILQVDIPAPGNVSQNFLIAGWAVDLGAANGTGIDTIHIWAVPTNGAPGTFLGVASLGGFRPDVSAYLNAGPQFGYSGYGLWAPYLNPGSYYIIVYPHSAVLGDFAWDKAKLIPVNVQ